jgi:hypothetical protein
MIQIRDNEVDLVDGEVEYVCESFGIPEEEPIITTPIPDEKKKIYTKSLRVFLEESLREVLIVRFKWGHWEKEEDEPIPTPVSEERTQEIIAEEKAEKEAAAIAASTPAKPDYVYPTDSITPVKFLYYLLFGVDYTEKNLSKVFVRYGVFRNILKHPELYGDYELFDLNKFIKNNENKNTFVIFDNSASESTYSTILRQYLKLFKFYGSIVDNTIEELSTKFYETLASLSQIDDELLNIPNRHLFDLFDDPSYLVNNFEFMGDLMKELLILYEITCRFIELIGLPSDSYSIPSDQFIKETFKFFRMEKGEIIYNTGNPNYFELDHSLYFFSCDMQTVFVKIPFNTPKEKLDKDLILYSESNNMYYKKYPDKIKEIFTTPFGSFTVLLENGDFYPNGEKKDENVFKDVKGSKLVKVLGSNIYQAYCFQDDAESENFIINKVILQYRRDDYEDGMENWLNHIGKEINSKTYLIDFNVWNLSPDEQLTEEINLPNEVKEIYISQDGTSILVKSTQKDGDDNFRYFNSGFNSFNKFGHRPSGVFNNTWQVMIYLTDHSKNLRQIINEDDYILYVLKDQAMKFYFRGNIQFDGEAPEPPPPEEEPPIEEAPENPDEPPEEGEDDEQPPATEEEGEDEEPPATDPEGEDGDDAELPPSSSEQQEGEEEATEDPPPISEEDGESSETESNILINESNDYGDVAFNLDHYPGYFINKIFNLGNKGLIIELVDNLETPTKVEYLYIDAIQTSKQTPETYYRNYRIFSNKPIDGKIIKVFRNDVTAAVLVNSGELLYIGKDFLINSEEVFKDSFVNKEDIVTSNHVIAKYDLHFLLEDFNVAISSTGRMFVKDYEQGKIVASMTSPIQTLNTFYVQFYNLFINNPLDKITDEINTNKQFVRFLSRVFKHNVNKAVFSKIIDTTKKAVDLLEELKIDSTTFKNLRTLNNVYKYNEFINLLNIDYSGPNMSEKDANICKLIKFFIYIALYAENLTGINDNKKSKYPFYTMNLSLPFEEKYYIKKITEDIRRSK